MFSRSAECAACLPAEGSNKTSVIEALAELSLAPSSACQDVCSTARGMTGDIKRQLHVRCYVPSLSRQAMGEQKPEHVISVEEEFREESEVPRLPCT